MRSRRLDITAMVFFLLIVSVFFGQTIVGGKLPVPSDSLVGLYHPWRDFYSKDYPRGIPFKNFLITDPVRQQIPWRKIAVDQWKEGKLPLWNPYTFSGAPLLGNIQAAVLYPINILFFLFSFADAWTILIILQPLLAGLFMYWYLRSLAIRPIAGLLGAVAWSFSGFNVAWLTWGTIGHVALWLPLALLAIDRTFVLGTPSSRDRSDGDAISHQREIATPSTPRNDKITWWSTLFVASMTFQFFAGHAQISLYFVIVVIAYAAFRKALGIRFIFLLGLVVLITSVQWMPLWAWLRESGRIIGTDWHKEGWFIPWQHLVQFVAPDFFGNPTTLNYWGQWNYGEFIGYVGLLPLIFTVIALFAGTVRVRIFWVITLAVGLVLALPTPIASLPFVLEIPIFSSLQPTRLIFVIDFALAVLAALGCHAFFENGKKRLERIPIVILGIALAILWIISVRFSPEVSRRNLVLPTVLYVVSVTFLFIFKRSIHVTMFRNIVTWSMLGLTAIDLLRFGWKFTPFTPREYFFPETKLVAYLKQQPKPFRVVSVDKRILPPNTASYFGIESIEGYDPLISSRYEELMAAIARGAPDIKQPFGFNRIVSIEHVDIRLLRLFGVRYVLALKQLDEPGLREVFAEGDTRVYEIVDFVPRAYLAERYLERPQKQAIIDALFDPMFQPGKHAVVELPIRVLQSTPLHSSDSVHLVSYSPTLIELSVNVFSIPRLLVVQNAYNSGWRAAVDGKTTMILRANYAFQGVVVPEGTHKVVFSYSL